MFRFPPALRIVLYYILLAVLWILFSDQVIEHLASNKSVLSFLQTIKGISFVFLSAALLYFYLNKIFKKLKAESANLARVQDDFEEEQNLFKRITNTGPVAIVVLDKDGKITFANPYSRKLFQTGNEDVSFKHYSDLSIKILDMEGNPIPENRLPFEILKDSKESHHHIHRAVRTAGGRIVYLSISAAPLYDKHNEFEGMVVAMIDISDQIQSEEKFKQAQITYRGILDSINEGVFVSNKNSRFFYVNRSMQLMFGYSFKDLIGQSYEYLAAPGRNDLEKLKQTFECVFNGEVANFEFWGRTKEGVIFPADVNLATGTYFGMEVIVGVIREITDRKIHEEKLKASEERYRMLFDKNPLPMMVYEIATLKFLDVNSATIEKYGYSRDEFLSMTIKDIRPEEDIADFMEELDSFKIGVHRAGVWRHKVKSGRIIFVEITSHEIDLNNTKARIALANDVTEKVKAEEERKQLADRLNHYLSTSPSIIFSLDIVEGRGILAWVSENVSSILGYTPDEILNHEWWKKNIHPDDRELIIEQNPRIFETGSLSREYRFFTKDNNLVWLHDELRLLKDGNGKPKEIVGTWTNISKQKEIEIELRKSELKFRSIFENIQDVYFESATDGRVLEVSPSIFVLSKGTFKREDLINKYMRSYYSVNTDSEDFARRLRKGERVTDYEMNLMLSETEAIPCSITAKIVQGTYGESKIVGTIRDISQRKKNEAELIKAKEIAESANRLKSEFLAQMSHEIRTPINVILSSTSVIEDHLNQFADEDIRAMFPIAKSAGARIIRTIDSILNMSEIQSGTYQEKMKIIDLYNDVLFGLHNEFKIYAEQNKLELICECNSENTRIYGDEYSITQIFSNLIDNAIKYTEKGYVKVSISDSGNSGLLVEVADTGRGIKKEYIPHLFEPFTQEEQGYTRKYEGNGLGLALVLHYCEMNNAEITVESEVKVGSIFKVELKKFSN